MELVDPTRFDGHNERFNICCTIISTRIDFSVFDNEFAESSDYESSKLQRMWDSIRDPRSTIGALMYVAKGDNPVSYSELITTNQRSWLTTSLIHSNHQTFAKILHDEFQDIYANSGETWYAYNGSL